jgi:hypothetical protein
MIGGFTQTEGHSSYEKFNHINSHVHHGSSARRNVHVDDRLRRLLRYT